METLEVRAEEEQLDALAIKLFTQHDSQFIPLYPWVLVRVLPREQMIGHIVIPDGKSSNKPVHEAIVLQTWKKFLEFKTVHSEVTPGRPVRTLTHIERASEFVPGDHVVYPHFVGLPVPGWDERYYRIVPECVKKERGIEWNGIILGKLNYPKTDVKTRVTDLIRKHFKLVQYKQPQTLGGAMMFVPDEFQSALENEFDIVYKEKASKTVSGR